MDASMGRKEWAKEEATKLYDLKLHEFYSIPGESVRVLRVPGGWLYTSYMNGYTATTFVTFDNEFQPSAFGNGRRV